MRRSTTPRRDDRGVVTIELILALPVLLMLILAVIVLGNYLNLKTQTTGLARDGARAASLRLTLPDGTSIVGAPCPDPTDPTQYVTVQATKDVTLRSIPLMPDVLPATITETVTMRCGG
jgi:hypothetical protein